MNKVIKKTGVGKTSSISDLTAELKLALESNQVDEADALYKDIAGQYYAIDTIYSSEPIDSVTIFKTFNLKPSNSFHNYSAHFIQDDAEAIAHDWSSVGDSLRLAFAKNYMKHQLAK